jgi:hypothetical protein
MAPFALSMATRGLWLIVEAAVGGVKVRVHQDDWRSLWTEGTAVGMTGGVTIGTEGRGAPPQPASKTPRRASCASD